MAEDNFHRWVLILYHYINLVTNLIILPLVIEAVDIVNMDYIVIVVNHMDCIIDHTHIIQAVNISLNLVTNTIQVITTDYINYITIAAAIANHHIIVMGPFIMNIIIVILHIKMDLIIMHHH